MNKKLPSILLPMGLWSIFFFVGISSNLNFIEVNFYEKTETMYNPINANFIFWKILKNNLSIITINILGFTSFGVLCILSILINGFSLGSLISNAINENLSSQQIIMNLLPHGIFELMGLWFSSTAGIYSTILFIKILKGNNITKNEIKFYVRFTLLAIILTTLSSIIESYYTLPKNL